jgi:hypothetical protein
MGENRLAKIVTLFVSRSLAFKKIAQKNNFNFFFNLGTF